MRKETLVAGGILALDIGTHSTKAVLFDRRGIIVAEAEAKHATSNQTSGQQEQNACDWWQSTVAAVRRSLDRPNDVAAVVLSGTMQNVIPVGYDGEPLRPAILYSDSRGSAQFDASASVINATNMPSIIGNSPNEFMAAFKMRWLLENEPDVFERSAVLHSGAKDYIIHCLTGQHVTDPTAATTVGLMDLAQRSWHSELLCAFGIPAKKLPAIKPSRSVVGRLTARAADHLGLPAGVPVINGLGDAGASTLGAGLRHAGEAYIYLGTTAWVARVSRLVDVALPARTFVLAHPDPDKVIEVAPILSGGDCVEWLLAVLGTDLDSLGARIREIDASPPDLLFLPYLKGERSPFIDVAVRGGFLMIDRSHGPAEMFYAVMEGIALSLRENLDALGVQAKTIRLLGGGGISDVWPQLIADATGRGVEVANDPRTAPAFGAFCEAAAELNLSHGANRFGAPVLPRLERSDRSEERRQLFLAATGFVRNLPRC
jgi:xylulokinase